MQTQPRTPDAPEPTRHSVTIGTRAQANRASVNTLFRPIGGRTATRHIAYDLGKYATNLRGRVVEVRRDIVALYTERRRDSHGPYWALRCVTTD